MDPAANGGRHFERPIAWREGITKPNKRKCRPFLYKKDLCWQGDQSPMSEITPKETPSASSAPIWPQCYWRTNVNTGFEAVCQHARVRTPGNVVNPAICWACGVRDNSRE